MKESRIAPAVATARLAKVVTARIDEVLPFALGHLERGHRVCLVTLVGIDGSSPRTIGAQMAITDSGRFMGSFTGGCLEAAVVAESKNVLKEGRDRLVRYGRGSPYFDIVLPCGSGLDLYFDAAPDPVQLAEVIKSTKYRQPGKLTLCLQSEATEPSVATLELNYLPRVRLAIAGDSDSIGPIRRLAVESGLDVEQCESYSNEGIPGLLDQWTGIALLYHQHDREEVLLQQALRSECFYIGALGSHASQSARRELLLQSGFSPSEIARIRAPIGLIPSAKNPNELAVSVLAEVIDAARTHLAG